MKSEDKNEGRSLEELERELYRRYERPTFEEENEEEILSGPTESIKTEEGQGNLSSFGHWRVIWLLAAVILAATALAIFVFWRGFFSFTKNQVDIEIIAPESIVAGEEVTWQVKVHNKNNSALEDGELIFRFPRNSLDPSTDRLVSRLSRSIGSLEPGQSREEEFKAIVIGGDDFERDSQVLFRFRPEGSSLILEEEKKHILKIESFPVEVEIGGPAETLSGETVGISFKLFNKSEKTFNNLRLRIEYPSGFRFLSSRETLEDFNTIWPVSQLLPLEERENKITGEVTGLEGEGKIFRAFLEYREPSGWQTYKENSFRSNLAVLPLTLSLRLGEEQNRSVSLGDNLTYELTWRNNFDIPLSTLTLKAFLQGELFNLSSLKTNGSVNTAAKSITWGESQLSSLGVLRPGEQGVVTFRLGTVSSFPLSLINPTFILRAEIESETKPTGLTVDKVRTIVTKETKVNGELSLDSLAYYNEPSGLIKNSGPYPLKVGGLTTFTIHWKLASFVSAFDNIRIKAVLPSGVIWQDENIIRGSVGEISYDSFSREAVWEIDRLEANQGRVSPLEAIFKIGIQPVPSQIGQVPALLSETELLADDNFTNNRFTLIKDQLDSRIPNDPAGGGLAGRVQE